MSLLTRNSAKDRAHVCRRISLIISALGVVVGALALVGWNIGVPDLTSVSPNLASMKPNTALVFVIVGVALWCSPSSERRGDLHRYVTLACGAAGMLITVLAISEHAFGWNLHLDNILIRQSIAAKSGHPGPMAASTVVGLLLVNVSLILNNAKDNRRRVAAELCALIAASIGFIAVLGYIYNVRMLYGVSFYSSMAIQTALLLILFGLAVLLANSEEGVVSVVLSDKLGGSAARQLLPLVTALPIIIGWLRLYGQRAGWFGTDFGLAVAVFTSVTMFSAVVWTSARWLNAADDLRARAQERSAQLAAIVESSQDAIIGKDDRGIVTSWNAAAQRIFGYTSEEIVGQSITRLMPPDRQCEENEILSRIMHGEMIEHFETVRQRKDGGFIEVSLTISPIRDSSGKVVGASKIARDITGKKRAEAALYQSQRQLTAIVDSAMDAILTIDERQRIVVFNRAAEEMFECRQADALGTSIDRFIPQRYRSAHASHIREFAEKRLTGRAMGVLGSLWALRASGEEFPIEASISQIQSHDQRLFTVILRDITERARAEESLREQAELINASQTIARDMQDRIVFWSDGAHKMYGFSAQEALGAVSHELFHTKFSEPLERINECLRETGRWEGELVHRKRDATTIVVSSSWILHRDKDGVPIRVLESLIDVTARKRADEQLILQGREMARQTEELSQSRKALEEQTLMLQSVLDSISEGLVAADENGRFLLWNEAAKKIIGLDPAEIPSREWNSYYGVYLPDTITPFPPEQNPLALAMRGHVSNPVMFIRNDAVHEGVFIDAFATPLRGKSGAIRGGVVAFHDITERRRVEEAARQSEERFARAFKSSPTAVTISSQNNGQYIDANDAFLQLLGYDLEEIVAHTDEELRIWAQPDQRLQMDDKLKRYGSVRSFEAEFRTRQNEIRHVSISVEVISVDGAPCNLATIVDLTETRSLEMQFRQAQKMEAFGRLAGGIAHDFNNLLGVIMGYSDLAHEQTPPDTPARLFLEKVHQAVEKAAALTNQLLAFSRQQVLQPKVINLNSLVAEFSEMLHRVIGEDISLRLAVAKAVGNIRVDPGQVEQILMNLVVNARDAMPAGGSIAIETSNAELDDTFVREHQRLAEPGSYVMLSVSDTGCGMDQATLSKIFDPFFTTKPVGRGTGLGLSTVYGIVKQSGGYIWVYSEPGIGTSFKIYFPRLDESVQPVETIIPELECSPASETILVVEDDEDLRNLAATLLRNEGYKVLIRSGGDDAVKLLEESGGAIDLLLTDVIMPGISGADLAVRFHAAHPQSKVLYMSGYTAGLTIQRHLDESITYLQKPFTRASLLKHVRMALSADAEHPG